MCCRQIGEIAVTFLRRGGPVGMHPATPLVVPLLRPEEKYLVFLDGTAKGVTVIVPAQQILFTGIRWHSWTAGKQEKIPGVQKVVAAEVENVSVELVASALGYDVDLSAACATVLRTIAVSLDLELVNAIDRGVNQNSALRPYVVITGAIHGPLIVH